ncbi:hypothetical protein QQ045_016233 [Rhodiola kirilowii]
MSSSSRATVYQNMDVDDFLHPRPIDTSVWTMQSVHHNEAIWRNQMNGQFKSDEPLRVTGHNVVSLNPRLTQYFEIDGFLPWSQREDYYYTIGRGASYWLTHRWGARVWIAEGECEPLCLSLLGAVPDRPKQKLMGSKTWFDDYLNHMPTDADEETLRKYARAYISCLLGLTLMLDLYGDQVALHYLPLLADLDNVMRYICAERVMS